MTYNFNGKVIEIPDVEIQHNMKALDIPITEAIEMWLDDHDLLQNEEAEEMTKKAKAVKRYEKSDTPRKKANKERKVDEEKKHILSCVRVLLEGLGAINVSTKNEVEIHFVFGENDYTLKLTKHRPPKKQLYRLHKVRPVFLCILPAARPNSLKK